MRRPPTGLFGWALALSFVVAASFGVWADDPSQPAEENARPQAGTGDNPSAEENAAALSLKQDAVALRFRRFEKTLRQMAEYMRKTDPERANLLYRAIHQSSENRIAQQLEEIVALLGNEHPRFGEAVERQQDVNLYLTALLKLLQSEDRKADLEKEKKRLEELVKQVNELIVKEKRVRNATDRRQMDPAKIADQQQKVADETRALEGKIDRQDAEKRGASASGKQSRKQSGEGKSGDANEDQPKEGEEQGGDSKKGEPKDGESKDGENKDSEGKSGSQKGKSGDGRKSDGKSGEKQSSEDKQGKDDTPDKDENDDKGSEEAGKSDEENSEKGKSAKGKSGKSKSGKGKSSKGRQEQQDSDDQQSDSSQQPQQQDQQDSSDQQERQAERTPGREELEQARREMEEAIEKLKSKKLDDASGHQDEALKQLMKAKERLEEILRQLREEERELLLAALEARFQKMLAMQILVNKSTVDLHKVPKQEWTSQHFGRTRELAGQEDEIAVEAAKALTLLKEEGSSVAFPEAVTQLHQDMLTVARRLERSDVADLTQAIEQDIVESLSEIIEALRKEMEKLKEEQQQQKSMQQQQGDKSLVDQLAELKMLRSLQHRVNRRTKQLGAMTKGEQATDPDVVTQFGQLSQRQARIQEATYDLSTGKNR